MRYPFTVAVIGSGFMGETHLGVWVNKAERVILCSNDREKGAALAARFGCAFYGDYKEMLKKEKVDIASVCVPTPLHAPITVDCLRGGAHVLCEKPFAPSTEEAEEMIRVAEETGKLLMVAHCVRFSKHYEFLRRCIAEQRFGKLRYLHLYRHSAAPAWSTSNWLTDPGTSGGVVRDMHIHDTDLIKHLLGTPQSVYTTGDPLFCSTVYRFDGDCFVTAAASWRGTRSFAFESGFDASFESAVVRLAEGKLQLITDAPTGYSPEAEEYPSYLQGETNYENEIEYLCQCLTQGVPPLHCMPEENLESLRINMAEFQSLTAGEPVKL